MTAKAQHNQQVSCNSKPSSTSYFEVKMSNFGNTFNKRITSALVLHLS